MPCLKSKDLYTLTLPEIKTRYNTHLKKCIKCRTRLEKYDQLRHLIILSTGTKKKSPHTSDCIDPMLLLDYLEDQTKPQQNHAIQDHLAKCSDCLEEMVRLQDYLKEISVGAKSCSPQRGWDRISSIFHIQKGWFIIISNRLKQSTRPVHRWAFVAGIMMVTMVIIWTGRSPFSSQMILRDQSVPANLDRIKIISPEQNDRISGTSRTFSWTGPEQVIHYDFLLLGQEGDIIFEQKVRGNRITLPEDLVLNKEQPYFWQVEAYLINGVTLRSEMIKFFY